MKKPTQIVKDNRKEFRHKLTRLVGLQQVTWQIRKAAQINNEYLRR